MNTNEECPCTVHEAQLFEAIPKQVTLESGSWVDVHPVNNLDNDSPIEFEVNGSGNEFVDLNNTMLEVQVKLVANDGKKLNTANKISLVNNSMHSLFSDVMFTLKDKVIEGGENMYAYKAYLSNLLMHSASSKATHLKASGWYKETDFTADTDKGFIESEAKFDTSKAVTMSGPLLLDICMQNKYLLQNTDFKIKLTRNKPEFACIIRHTANTTNTVETCKIIIQRAKLHVRRVKGIPSLMNEIEDNLNLQNAVYPIQRTEMITYTISSGVKSDNKESLFRGLMPKAVFVVLVDNDAYNGAYRENPFKFDNYKVKNIALYREGNSIPGAAYTPDFANNDYAREYMSLIAALNMYNKADDIGITPKEYANGFTIFAFNLTPDLVIGGHSQTEIRGNLRLNMQFSAALADNVNVVVMGIYDSKIEITKTRQVIAAWKA